MPRALSHIGLINSALYLSEARERALQANTLDAPFSPTESAERAPGPIGPDLDFEADDAEGEPGHSD